MLCNRKFYFTTIYYSLQNNKCINVMECSALARAQLVQRTYIILYNIGVYCTGVYINAKNKK